MMEILAAYKVCSSHPALRIEGKGKITGGRSEKQACKADLWVMLDNMPIDISVKCLDTEGKFTKVHHSRIIYFPIPDREIPKDQVLFLKILAEIDKYIEEGKHVHISCIGGHGRTGMVIAAYIGKYCKYENPVELVRERYCKNAVETYEQHKLIHSICGLPNPSKKEYETSAVIYSGYGYSGFYSREDRNGGLKSGTLRGVDETFDDFMRRKHGYGYADTEGGDTFLQ